MSEPSGPMIVLFAPTGLPSQYLDRTPLGEIDNSC
jgi:hypothetical protein